MTKHRGDQSVATFVRLAACATVCLQRLSAVVANYGKLLIASRNLDFFTSFYRFLIQLLPAAVVAPLFFAGEQPHRPASQWCLPASTCCAVEQTHMVCHTRPQPGASPSCLTPVCLHASCVSVRQDRVWCHQPELLSIQPHPQRRVTGGLPGNKLCTGHVWQLLHTWGAPSPAPHTQLGWHLVTATAQGRCCNWMV